MSDNILRDYGWNRHYETLYQEKSTTLIPGRVTAQLTQVFRVMTAQGELLAEKTGKLQFQAENKTELPVIGDWVLCQSDISRKRTLIQEILPRQSVIIRKKRDFGQARSQILAANIDYLGIVSSLDETLNLPKIERFLTLCYESKIPPLLIFNKTDRCNDLSEQRIRLHKYFPDLNLFFTSALTKEGIRELQDFLSPGTTLAFVGSSGAGKSTLINDLYGSEILATAENREKDQKGRHTTSHKELILLPGKSMIIDTPGLREIALLASQDSLDSVYAHLTQLAAQCRFSNCSHSSEPGCAVQSAIAAGDFPPEKLKNFLKQKQEISAHDEEQQRRGNAKRHLKNIAKPLLKHKKNY